MDLSTAKMLFGASIALYGAAALTGLVFARNQKTANILSNILCIFAAAAGIASSATLIFSDAGPLKATIYASAVPNIGLSITIDRLSAFFILMLSILVFCVSIYSIGYASHYYGKKNTGLFNFLYAFFILSMVFVMAADNAAFFLIAWEAMAVVSYLLVVFESEDAEVRKAGLIYVVMTHIGTAFLMIAFMIIYSQTGSFAIFGSSAELSSQAKNIVFVLFLIGFGTKGGIIPVHIWLPHAHPAAPGNISALMSGIMIKTAIYGMLRFIFDFLGIEAVWWGIAILVLGACSAFLGVAYAFIEQNFKRMLAFSSIENMGIILMGIGVAFIASVRDAGALGALALAGALLHSFNHALFKGCLFLEAGSVHYATHTKNMEELGGLIRKMPVTAVIFLAGALSISAIVPFNGFVGEWLTYQALFAGIVPGEAPFSILFILSAAVLAIAGGLAAACFTKLFGISFLGLPRTSLASDAHEVPASMNAGAGILAFLCLAAGIFPMAVLNVIDSVIVELTGRSAIAGSGGGILPVFAPVEIGGGSIAPQWIPALMAVSLLLILAVARAIGGKYSERRYGTWDCGFEALNPRMQYSGTAFSKPIRVIFRMIYRSTRDLKVKGDFLYHPEAMEYTLKTDSVFEKHVYDPILKWATRSSKKIKYSVQTGSVHMYLLYIFISILALMLYNRIV